MDPELKDALVALAKAMTDLLVEAAKALRDSKQRPRG